MSKIVVIGAGHVGLVTAGTLAELGHAVSCLDIASDRIESLWRGELPVIETGLKELLEAGSSTGLLRFGVLGAEEVSRAEFVFLCVPTPSLDDGEPDLSAVVDAASRIASSLSEGAVVVTKSTAPVGSTLVIESAIGRRDISVVSNPEFLREARAVTDSRHPRRIVIGSDDKLAAARVANLFRGLDAPLIITDPATAETIKYAANAYLALKISFANCIASLCGSLGADLDDLLLGLGYDDRIGFDAMAPGPGWGGSCLPKDTAALCRTARDVGCSFPLLDAAIEVNERQHARVLAGVRAVVGELAGSTIAILGLAFKAGTEDLRDSPAVRLANELAARGASVRAFDPAVPKSDAPCTICTDPYSAATGADVVVVMTEWEEFRWVDYRKLAELMARRVVIDTRRILDPGALRRAGLQRIGIEDL